MHPAEAPMQPLCGVRVADFSSNMAGPFGAMILAGLGADVVKVESPQGDDARQWPPFVDGVSATHRHMSAGKRGMVIDLKRAEGVEVALTLAASSDVVLHSMRPGVAERIGIGRAQVVARNPDILYYELNAFGGGPVGRGMPGYDPLIQAYSGIMAMTGHEGTPPTRCAPSIIDLGTGQWIAMGVLAALLAKEKGHAVGSIETALIDTAFSLVPHQAMNARMTGARPAKSGSGNTIAAPYQCFAARDGDIMIAAANDRLWQALVRVLDEPALAADPRFASNRDRVANVHALANALTGILATRDVDTWVDRLSAAGVPAARVSGLEQAVRSDIAGERQTFVERGGVPTVRLPWVIDGRTLGIARPAPQLGEHSIEVMKELGYDDAQIEKLVAAGVVVASSRATVAAPAH